MSIPARLSAMVREYSLKQLQKILFDLTAKGKSANWAQTLRWDLRRRNWKE